jgi:hypothetical protein
MMTNPMVVDAIGWLATAVFVVSYRFSDQRLLRRTQAMAAVLWIAYGLARHAMPVVIANLLVAGMAVYSSRRQPSFRPAAGRDRALTS